MWYFYYLQIEYESTKFRIGVNDILKILGFISQHNKLTIILLKMFFFVLKINDLIKIEILVRKIRLTSRIKLSLSAGQVYLNLLPKTMDLKGYDNGVWTVY